MKKKEEKEEERREMMKSRTMDNFFMKCAFVEYQGRRQSMEDKSIFKQYENGVNFFGVFDGHGGIETAEYLENVFTDKFQEHVLPFLDSSEDEIKEKIETMFCLIDNEILNLRTSSGSTALVLVMTMSKFICINLGDSRCILRTNGNAIPLSIDHKPSRDIELNRISNAGGNVYCNRVNGTLAVSRAFGDFSDGLKLLPNLSQKDQPVSCVPEITFTQRDKNDHQIILACDGLWDVMDVENISWFLDMPISEDIKEVAKDLVEFTFNRGSTDNISVILIEFKKVSQDDLTRKLSELLIENYCQIKK